MYNMHLAFSNTYNLILFCLHIYYPEQALYTKCLMKTFNARKSYIAEFWQLAYPSFLCRTSQNEIGKENTSLFINLRQLLICCRTQRISCDC